MKYRFIVEYEYPTDHKPPVSAEIVLHGDRVKAENILPYKQGEWIYKEMKGQFCSVCNTQSVWKFNYCPNCGASMLKEGEADDT